jgi:cardiolipin synthase
VHRIDEAFRAMWALMGDPVPVEEAATREPDVRAGDAAVRIVATVPSTAGLFRLGQLVAALARERLWLTDAYYAGTTPYVQALRAAARDGVDVRLLVPNGTDIPLLRPLSRAGYRTLLDAGARVFEWNGPMLHAKTAVADGRWARVGSSNLNIASWLGNYELDVVVEDESFAKLMEAMYVEDLSNATEIVLDRRRPRAAQPRPVPSAPSPHGGSAGRAAAGLLRVSNTVGAAISDHRELGPVEARIMIAVAIVLVGLGVIAILFPRLLAYPLAVMSLWIAAALLWRGYRLRRRGRTLRSSSNSS